MADPYSGVAITGYNSNPPADDGSQTEANRVKWSTTKAKLTDPVKTRTDDMNTALIAAFGKMLGGAGITNTSISYTVLSTDQGKLVRATSSGITVTTPSATDVAAPFVFCLLNDTTGDITLDGSGAQTIDGDASVTIPAGCGLCIYTDGTNWFTTGQNFQRTLVRPQGYLTLLAVATQPTSPVPATDQAGKTAVYYRPDGGNLAPIPNGTTFAVREFTELTLTLNSNHVANGIYDVFLFDDAGTIRIGTGPVWNTVTAGSGARGTGAGTSELDLLKGMLVNKVSMTARNGATTYSVAAASGLYIGSIMIDGSAGQVSCTPEAGQSRKWGVWNAYNRRTIQLLVTDLTASWTDAPTTWRQSQGDTGNTATLFCGLAEEIAQVQFVQSLRQTFGNSTCRAQIGIGINSTTTPTGVFPEFQAGNNVAGNYTSFTGMHTRASLAPSIGINNFNCLEQAPQGTTSNQFFGGSENMRLELTWRG